MWSCYGVKVSHCYALIGLNLRTSSSVSNAYATTRRALITDEIEGFTQFGPSRVSSIGDKSEGEVCPMLDALRQIKKRRDALHRGVAASFESITAFD